MLVCYFKYNDINGLMLNWLKLDNSLSNNWEPRKELAWPSVDEVVLLCHLGMVCQTTLHKYRQTYHFGVWFLFRRLEQSAKRERFPGLYFTYSALPYVNLWYPFSAYMQNVVHLAYVDTILLNANNQVFSVSNLRPSVGQNKACQEYLLKYH